MRAKKKTIYVRLNVIVKFSSHPCDIWRLIEMQTYELTEIYMRHALNYQKTVEKNTHKGILPTEKIQRAECE